MFVTKMAEYFVTRDQSFQDVQCHELQDLLDYTHQQTLHFPSPSIVQRRVIDLSNNAIKELKQFFQVCK